ncbi:Bromodomain-containing protein [Panus rudis PR-1116 ss-1]|nr:Bromodomain-containing protein [Panus rudis PR-1116 ss-1]
MRLPSKRQYPDYYQQIKHPISLDEIKQQLDRGAYTSFEDVRQDLEQCFKNAKRYNMKDSQIWRDAKYLHKVVTKEAARLSGKEEPQGDPDEGDEHAGHSSEVEGEDGKKKKAPNMNRVLKTRLEKLVNLKDANGRIRSAEFMELPNRKKWAIYYKTIKKPQCLENVFKKLKRKEYHTAVDFANDVELVFSNALEFNQEHSQLWDDAIALRDYFRQLMADLPPPYTIPSYASQDHSTKIKLKMYPAPSAASTTPATNSTALLLRVPGQNTSSSTTPKQQVATLPVARSPQLTKVAASPKPPVATPTIPSTVHIPAYTQPKAGTSNATLGVGGLQPAKFTQPTYPPNTTHYPNAIYQQPRVAAPAATSLPNANTINPRPNVHIQAPTQPTAYPARYPQAQAPVTASTTPVAPSPVATPAIPLPPVVTAVATSVRTPTPTTPSNHNPLRSVTMVVMPSERHMQLDQSDGVRIWAFRVEHGETSLRVDDVRFVGEEEESTQEPAEEEENVMEAAAKDTDVEMLDAPPSAPAEEEEEEQPVEKPVKRGRGRPRKNKQPEGASDKSQGKAPSTLNVEAKSKMRTPVGEIQVQVKYNGAVVKGKGRRSGWNIDVAVGHSLLEIGEKSGMTWRVYLERPIA